MANLNKIAAYLQRHGWTWERAGKDDFAAAVLAIGAAVDKGLGLIVSGDPGTGKTTLIKTIAPAFSSFKSFDCKNGEDVERLTKKSQEFWAENLQEESVFLDDVGAEKEIYIDFVLRNVVMEFMVERAELYPNGPAPRLWIATNLNAAQFDDFYDGRLYSRMKVLCVPLHLSGKDKRTWTKPAPATFDFPVSNNP